MTQPLHAIWCQDLDHIIAVDSEIPWRHPEDLAHFRATTLDHPIIMGRATWDATPELDRRPAYVATRADHKDFRKAADKAFAAISNNPLTLAATALKLHPDGAYVIGGRQIFDLLLPYCADAIVTTLNQRTPVSDEHAVTYAPTIPTGWTREDLGGDAYTHPCGYTITRHVNPAPLPLPVITDPTPNREENEDA